MISLPLSLIFLFFVLLPLLIHGLCLTFRAFFNLNWFLLLNLLFSSLLLGFSNFQQHKMVGHWFHFLVIFHNNQICAFNNHAVFNLHSGNLRLSSLNVLLLDFGCCLLYARMNFTRLYLDVSLPFCSFEIPPKLHFLYWNFP
jgi:hypothetical protein